MKVHHLAWPPMPCDGTGAALALRRVLGSWVLSLRGVFVTYVLSHAGNIALFNHRNLRNKAG